MAEVMPSLLRLEDCQTESECLSDSDLPSGAPSPDASDDEEIRNCTDSGITTPYFFNKLREMIKPLFHIKQDLSPGGITGVSENVADKAKSYKSKKRVVKDNGSENAAGVIERHYGYIPNPRWPKVMSSIKYFNPKGLGKEDEAGIPGIVFRGKAPKNHSFQENDFPELNSSSKDDSSFITSIHSHGDASAVVHKKVSFSAPRDSRSPVTSTPLRHEYTSPCDRSSLTQSPAPNGVNGESHKDDFKQEETIQRKNESKSKSGSKNNRRRSKRLSLSPSVGMSSNPPEQSWSDVSDINSSSSFMTARGDWSGEGVKAELNVIGESSSPNEYASETQNTTCHNRHKGSQNNGSCQVSITSPHAHAQATLSPVLDTNQASFHGKDKSLDLIPNAWCRLEEKKTGMNNNNNNFIKSPSWSQVASRSSSPVPVNNSVEGMPLRSVPSLLTVDTRPASPSWSQAIKASPAPSPNQAGLDHQVKTAKGGRLIGDETHQRSSPVSVGTQRCWPLEEAGQSNPRRKSGQKVSSMTTVVDNLRDPVLSPNQAPDSVWTNNKNRPSSPLRQASEPANLRPSGKNTPKGEVKHQSFTDALKTKENGRKVTEWQRNSSNNNKGTGKRGEKQRAKLLTLDNFITPKKTGKDHWPNHGTQDMNAFEKRFVEHIEASATSPPKKVRPSPIKKLNFSLEGDKNSSSESDTTKGEGAQIVPDNVKAQIFKRQVSLIKNLDGQKLAKDKGQGSRKGKNNSTQSPRSLDVLFCLEDYVKKKEAPKDVLTEDEEDAVVADVNVKKEVEEFWKPKSLEGPLKLQLEGPLKSQLEGPLKSQLKGPLKSQLEGPLKSQLEGPMKSQLEGPMKSQLEGPMKSQLEGPLKSQLEGPLKSQLKGPMKSQLEGPLKSQAASGILLDVSTVQKQGDCEDDNVYRYYPKSLAYRRDAVIESSDVVHADKVDFVDPAKVTFKAQLKKYARRYCHVVEEHAVVSMADEIHFILQLLTPYQLDQETLNAVDLKVGGTAFRSVHNSVYFAVHIIKKLRRLFLCLPYPVIHLLAHNSRIKAFSPKLHMCFLTALSSRGSETKMPSPLEHNPFRTLENGVESFPETNFAHVFKCQRDNFYALYRQYHDQNAVHPFFMEEQIQYVYDCRTPEQNSVTNLMHLAELYLEHLIQSCLCKAHEVRRDVLLVGGHDRDESDFERMLTNFLNSHANTSFSPSSSRNVKGDKFFIDFIQSLRCPAFNEHLKNLLVSKIVELNGKPFDCVRNLHSSAIIGDDKTPGRCHDFGATVLSLCTMARILGHLVFLPYTSGAQDLPVRQEASVLRMREMVPLPIPLPLLLKQAFENGHLTVTVPWVAEFLSMMDLAAPKLSVYKGLLERLKYLQRYAWKTLYEKGHHNSGLLTVSSISELFQMAATSGHLSHFCDENLCEPVTEPNHQRPIDSQRLVSSALLYTCCPHLGKSLEDRRLACATVHSCAPLAVYAMEQSSVRLSRKIIPLAPSVDCASRRTMTQAGNEAEEEIRHWLGSAVQKGKTDKGTWCPTTENATVDCVAKTPDLQDEVTLPFVMTQSFSKRDVRIQNDLKINFVDGTGHLRSVVDTVVNLMCGKVEEYALNTILRLAAFEVKREVRSKFVDMEKGDDAETVKSQVLIHANILANKFSSEVRRSFFQVGDVACQKDLVQLVTFLTSCHDKKSRDIVIHVAEEITVQRLKEWASVQLSPDFFRRLIVREAERCGRPGSKPVTLLPNDFSRKLEDSDVNLNLHNGLEDLFQLSETMDKALSCGVWYINALTPGPRPDEGFMLALLSDLIGCIERRLVTIDFAFYVMANFLMHLIIQYIMDAPSNWSDACLEAFIKLCLLCDDRKSEDDRVSIRLADSARKTKNVKVKIFNLVSVFSVQWISKSLVLDHSLMVYCQTLVRVVEAGLMTAETLIHRLVKARGNHHMTDSSRIVVDRAMLKVLTLLYASMCQCETCSPARVLSLVLSLKLKFEEWGCDKLLHDLNVAFPGASGS